MKVVSDFNAEVFERYLRHDPEAPVLEVEGSPFNQLLQTLTQGDQDLDAFGLVWARPEGALPSFRAALELCEPIDLDALRDEVRSFAAAVSSFAACRRHVLVASFVVPPGHRGSGMLDWRAGVGLRHAIATANLALASSFDDAPNAHVLDAEAWISAGGSGAASTKQWYTSKVPYSNAVFQAAVPEVKAALVALSGRTRKLVIVDLDDTLWGGVVGDVGWEGIRLGGHDHVGEAFVDFQRSLKALTARGTLLGIVSKNTETVALEAIEKHPEMVLGLDDFAGWRISWDDKAANVAALGHDLNLGLDAVVFIDDNPVERARVADELPDVLVPDWPTDPAQYAARLRALTCFDVATVSAEDRARSQQYVVERSRRRDLETVGSLDDWLATLDLRVRLEALDASNLPRATQLLNKTNQMNLTTRRMTDHELVTWGVEPGRAVLTFSVDDRFGPSGLTGLVGLELTDGDATVVDLVLSCRVMGRRIEEAMLHAASAWARRAGAGRLVLRYLETPRNAPCADVLRASALTETSPGIFEWDLVREYPLPPVVALDGAP